MDTKYRQVLDQLLQLNSLNDWERNCFSDIVKRDEKFNITLSMKQRALVEKARDKHILGKETNEKGLSLPESYARCKLVSGGDHGTYIEIDGNRIDKPITRKEAQIVLAWIDGAEDDIAAAIVTQDPAKEEEQTVGNVTATEDENLPF